MKIVRDSEKKDNCYFQSLEEGQVFQNTMGDLGVKVFPEGDISFLNLDTMELCYSDPLNIVTPLEAELHIKE